MSGVTDLGRKKLSAADTLMVSIKSGNIIATSLLWRYYVVIFYVRGANQF